MGVMLGYPGATSNCNNCCEDISSASSVGGVSFDCCEGYTFPKVLNCDWEHWEHDNAVGNDICGDAVNACLFDSGTMSLDFDENAGFSGAYVGCVFYDADGGECGTFGFPGTNQPLEGHYKISVVGLVCVGCGEADLISSQSSSKSSSSSSISSRSSSSVSSASSVSSKSFSSSLSSLSSISSTSLSSTSTSSQSASSQSSASEVFCIRWTVHWRRKGPSVPGGQPIGSGPFILPCNYTNIEAEGGVYGAIFGFFGRLSQHFCGTDAILTDGCYTVVGGLQSVYINVYP